MFFYIAVTDQSNYNLKIKIDIDIPLIRAFFRLVLSIDNMFVEFNWICSIVWFLNCLSGPVWPFFGFQRLQFSMMPGRLNTIRVWPSNWSQHFWVNLLSQPLDTTFGNGLLTWPFYTALQVCLLIQAFKLAFQFNLLIQPFAKAFFGGPLSWPYVSAFIYFLTMSLEKDSN